MTCACGCGETPKVGRFRPGHFAREWTHYEVDAETGCWNWLLRRIPSGYGQIQRGSKTLRAHRWMYEQHIGPIPEGLELDHLCSNPACVNPNHLEPVTRRENARRSRQTKLTAGAVHEIHQRFQREGTSIRSFAKRVAHDYGVGKSTVRDALIGTTWTDIHAVYATKGDE